MNEDAKYASQPSLAVRNVADGMKLIKAELLEEIVNTKRKVEALMNQLDLLTESLAHMETGMEC